MASYPAPTRMIQRLQESIGEKLMISYPVKDLPLSIRPVIIFLTAAWLILLGILGMAPIPTIPINDKALHFFGMGFATFLVYHIIEPPEGSGPGSRVWYIRRAPLVLTLITSFFFGSIVSEFVQGLLPWKTFQWGDILANLLGSTLFLYLAHLLSQRQRRRRELSTLYQPLSDHHSSTYRDARGREHAYEFATGTGDSQPPRETRGQSQAQTQRPRAGSTNVWDEASDAGDEGRRSELFEIGDDGDGDADADEINGHGNNREYGDDGRRRDGSGRHVGFDLV